jgi:hypothetical protein
MASSHRSEDQLEATIAAPYQAGTAEAVTAPATHGARRFGKAQPIRSVRITIPNCLSPTTMHDHAGNGHPHGGQSQDGQVAKLAPSNGTLARKIRSRVRAAMREQYLTQWDVASACGITQSTLSAWLCGRKDLSGTHLLGVLETLRIDVGE